MTSTPTRSGMPGHFGIRITDADKDKLVGELDVDDRHLNNSGHVHGGALAAFADDLGGALAGLNVSPGFRTTTIESKTNIFRACVPGRRLKATSSERAPDLVFINDRSRSSGRNQMYAINRRHPASLPIYARSSIERTIL
jgi:uncharacterized protein (TIGR00369 family)